MSLWQYIICLLHLVLVSKDHFVFTHDHHDPVSSTKQTQSQPSKTLCIKSVLIISFHVHVALPISTSLSDIQSKSLYALLILMCTLCDLIILFVSVHT
jgi:hypothetical protein